MLLQCMQLKPEVCVPGKCVESTLCHYTTRGDCMLRRIARKSVLDWECCRERLSTQLEAGMHLSLILLTRLLARTETARRHETKNKSHKSLCVAEIGRNRWGSFRLNLAPCNHLGHKRDKVLL